MIVVCVLVNRNNYIIKEIPKFNPLSIDYLDFWKEQKRFCLYGMWSGGYWIPGTLYQYINLWHIELKENANDKTGKIGRPFFRDIDLDICIAYAEARGFSRFELQTPEDVVGKTAHDIMTAFYPKNMGKPLFENNAKNYGLVTNRGAGKSFNISNIIGYEFLHNEGDGEKKEIVVGAGDGKYSTDLLKKVKLGLDNLPGAIEHNGNFYPPPFSKKYRGSFSTGKYVEARYEVKKGNNSIWKGDGSSIKHVTYSDNVLAASGSRPVLNVKEEAGIFANLIQAVNADQETVRYGMNQFGTQILLGTGATMGKGVIDFSKIARSPEEFNMVVFEDKYENRGKTIHFIPVTFGLNEYKDENGNTKEQEALDKVVSYRKSLQEVNAGRSVIEQEMQNRPLTLSEAFLISTGNFFPRKELMEQLAWLETHEDAKNLGQVGELSFNRDGKVVWDISNRKREIIDYPLESSSDSEGSIVIWEHPINEENGLVPYGLYIAGSDPYDHDKSQTGSLGSVYIYKRFYSMEHTYDIIVAEYTGRPTTAEEWYENVRLLLLYYNARMNYENERKGIHQYFKFKECTHLLLDQPLILKDIIKNSVVDREKGCHMTKDIKNYGERGINSWLLHEFSPGKKNLTRIYSRGLLKELLLYNDDGNFDRVIALILVMIMRDELHKHKVKKVEREDIKKFFDVPLFINKPKYN